MTSMGLQIQVSQFGHIWVVELLSLLLDSWHWADCLSDTSSVGAEMGAEKTKVSTQEDSAAGSMHARTLHCSGAHLPPVAWIWS